ncbi:PPA1309 family protein [Corynebacterium caspium]|uniref:PPA1309 family protein n=1 Tax=Corynebacterium caspium TaxID=234828 RepID=UPI00037D7086|nr:PPA1309 family protein [Corynebacterium caspium]WKD59682.1 hypothetical protein CCASP_06515 [Corynebacterium caspium DSM 44850]
MTAVANTQQALNRAMLEAVDFVHREGWDAPPTLFGLVPTAVLADAGATLHDDDTAAEAPLTLVVQDALPENITAGSGMLADYLGRIAWPPQVIGVILAQEIAFRDASAENAEPRPARLFSGVLRSGVEQTLLQFRLTEEELEARGPFAEDELELHGGPEVAPEVIAALQYGLEQDPETIDLI